MKSFFYLFLITLFLSVSSRIQAADYYWVGGTGNYSDTIHWATTSGGSIFHSLPPFETDDVFFDANSFPSGNDTVYFDLDYSYSRDFRISGVTNTPTFFSNPVAISIEVSGNFILDPGINWQPTCDLVLNITGSSADIQTNGIFLTNQNFYLGGGAQANFSLLDDLHCLALDIENGLSTFSHSIYCDYVRIGSFYPIYLDSSVISAQDADFWIGGSMVNPPLFCDSAVFIITSSFNVEPSNSLIHFGTVHCRSITSNNCYYKLIVSPGPGFMGLYGNGNHIEEITGNINIGTTTYGSVPNYVTRIVADTLIANDNLVIDTLIFPNAGASLTVFDTLTIMGEWVMHNSPSSRGHISEAQDSSYINASSGIFCFDFTDIENVYAIGGAQFFAGHNSTAQPNHGWQLTGCMTAGGVWPGDANYDLIVDNLDILSLGLASNATGPVRPGASLAWIEQAMTAWTDTFPSGVNLKHADCNGDGVVNAVDTLAVSQNYSLIHPASRVKHEDQIATNYFLTLDVTPDSIGPLSPVHVNVDLSMDSVYGIAFSIKYDPEFVDPASFIPDFSNSWLGIQGVDMIAFTKILPAEGRIDFALTRTDHNDVVGGIGHLLSFDLVTSATVVEGSVLKINAENVSGMYLSGTYEPIGGASDSSYVDSTLGISKNQEEITNLIAYLNNDLLQLNFYVRQATEFELVLFDVTGRKVLSKRINAQTGLNIKEMSVNALSDGVYFLLLEGNHQREKLKIFNH